MSYEYCYIICSLKITFTLFVCFTTFVTDSDLDVDSETEAEEDPDDPDYVMSDMMSDDSMDEEDETTDHHHDHSPDNCSQGQDHRIYLVFWLAVLQLISIWGSCPSCASRRLICTRKESGTLLKLTIRCADCHHGGTWDSQPYYGRLAAGNILLSSGILFAGATATKVLRVLTHMGTAVMSIRTFFRHQKLFLHRAVMQLWRERQLWMLASLQAEDGGIVCGGDGRADSPGHSAKYGTYTMMELRKKAVIDIQVVQVCLTVLHVHQAMFL